MADLLQDLHRETGHTIVIVTHDPQEVARLASDVLFLEAGRIALGAPRETFLTRTDIPSIADFLRQAGGG